MAVSRSLASESEGKTVLLGIFLREPDVGVLWDTKSGEIKALGQGHQVKPTSAYWLFKDAAAAEDFFKHGKWWKLRLRNWFRFGDHIFLIRLALRSQKLLKPIDLKAQNPSDDFLTKSITAQIVAGAFGIRFLKDHDFILLELLKKMGSGSVEIRSADRDAPIVRVLISDGEINLGSEDQSASIEKKVKLIFVDVKTAYESISQLGDSFGMLGEGKLKVRGYLPLADKFNQALDRVLMHTGGVG